MAQAGDVGWLSQDVHGDVLPGQGEAGQGWGHTKSPDCPVPLPWAGVPSPLSPVPCPQFSCCGGVSYKDWSQNMYFNCTATNPSRERCSVPFSCCLHDANQVCPGVASGDPALGPSSLPLGLGWAWGPAHGEGMR